MGKIYYCRLDRSLSKEQIFDLLKKKQHVYNLDLQEIIPTEDEIWLTEGLHTEFATFIPLGTNQGKTTRHKSDGVIFKIYSIGVQTGRDAWAYNFKKATLLENISRFVETYHAEIDRWNNRIDKKLTLNDFLVNDEHKIKWSSRLKACLVRGQKVIFTADKIRHALYRPFCSQYLFFDDVLTHRQGQFPKIFPTRETESENRVIWVKVGAEWPMFVLMTNVIPDLLPQGGSQCFPFYIYTEDGTYRQENMTDWALKHFRQHYQEPTMTKWDIFYYIYGFLHQPHYREKYAANLKRELPRIPLVNNFWAFSQAGKQLAELHVHYEQQPEYPLEKVTMPGKYPCYRVEKMRLNKAKDAILYNETLTLQGIPPETFNYRLGNRSALEWVIEQYQVKIDGHTGSRKKLENLNDYQYKTSKGSGILNDPNRSDDEHSILRLIGQVITVSLATVKIVANLPEQTK